MENAKTQARFKLETIEELLNAYEVNSDQYDNDDALQAIYHYPLSVSVRSAWVGIGETMEPVEFNILLCTGGPAVRILGDIGANGEPIDARLQFCDWFKPWQDYPLNDHEEEMLLHFCQFFIE